jgi:hypothetical protein
MVFSLLRGEILANPAGSGHLPLYFLKKGCRKPVQIPPSSLRKFFNKSLPTNLNIDLNKSTTNSKNNVQCPSTQKRKCRENDFDVAEMRAKKCGKHKND